MVAESDRCMPLYTYVPDILRAQPINVNPSNPILPPPLPDRFSHPPLHQNTFKLLDQKIRLRRNGGRSRPWKLNLLWCSAPSFDPQKTLNQPRFLIAGNTAPYPLHTTSNTQLGPAQNFLPGSIIFGRLPLLVIFITFAFSDVAFMMSFTITHTISPTLAVAKKKGKKFVPQEELQLACSFLHISQWQGMVKRVQHFGIGFAHTTISIAHLVALRSLCSSQKQNGGLSNMMWISLLELFEVLCELGMNVENALQNTLELYKTKHPWNASFTFIHCWLVLKDVPCFGDVCAKS